jgi:hypothetical protein
MTGHALEARCEDHPHFMTDDGCDQRGCEDAFDGWAWAAHGPWCPGE